MKNFLYLLVTATCICNLAYAQTETKPKKKFDLSSRAADHFMIQFGADRWSGTPDSIRVRNNSKHFNFYIMLDKPFRGNPKFSVAYGAGIGTSNIFFDKNYVDVKSMGNTLPFRRSYPGSDSAYFEKFKLTTIYVEAPIELRYYSNPENVNKSWKMAIGAKIGTMIKAYTKGKDLKSETGASIYGPKFIEKQVERKYFNGTRLSVMARAGYGNFGLHFSYQINQLIKEGFGPEIRPFSIGLTISGL